MIDNIYAWSLSALVGCVALPLGATTQPPHIVMIVADDLGWNDIGRHNPDIQSPKLDALANQGVVLDQYAVFRVCSPTRAAILAGRIPYHMGMKSFISHTKPAAVSLKYTLLPQALAPLGYQSHMVGKWHLGFYSPAHLPAARGFQSSFGYLAGAEDFFQHTNSGGACKGLDLCTTLPSSSGASISAETNYSDVYSTYMFAGKAITVIEEHAAKSQGKPLFLYLAFQSVHEPLQVPKSYEDMYPKVKNTNRRIFSGMVTALDDAVGNVTAALESNGMLDNCLIIFTTDNGGNIKAAGNNWPLRGAKFTFWEGGTRGYAFVYSKSSAILPMPARGKTVTGLMHASDWFSTLMEVAGGQQVPASAIDSVSAWAMLTGKNVTSTRNEIIHVAYSKSGALQASSAVCGMQRKTHTACTGSNVYNNTKEASEEDCCARCAAEDQCAQWTYHAVKGLCDRVSSAEPSKSKAKCTCGIKGGPGPSPGPSPPSPSPVHGVTGKIRSGRFNYYIGSPGNDAWTPVPPALAVRGEGKGVCLSAPGCLFDVLADPNERTNVAEQNPEVVKELLSKLAAAATTCPDGMCTLDVPKKKSGNDCSALKELGTFGPWYPNDDTDEAHVLV